MGDDSSTVVLVPPSGQQESKTSSTVDRQPTEEFKPSRMKVVGILAQAVKRFQGQLGTGT